MPGEKRITKAAYTALIGMIKGAGECADCGESDPIVLEFDHLEPRLKSFTISQAIGLGKTLTEVKLELEKCELVCANCHKRRTARRHQNGTAFRRGRPTTFKIPFRDWCLRRRVTESPEGDFLEDVRTAEKLYGRFGGRHNHLRLPEGASLEEIIDFLGRRNACYEAIAAAKTLWRVYSAQQRLH